MARTSSLPEDVTRFKPCKCCRIRNDNGVYRVYKYSSVKLSSGQWSNDYGYLIGKIIPGEGFFPNKRYQKELSEQYPDSFPDGITDVAYGQYALLLHLTKDILDKLKTCFLSERATQIYSYAMILCANGFVHIDQIDDFYQESFLSVLYRQYSFKMGYVALSNLLHDLGLRGNPVRQFEQNLIDACSKDIAIDGHVIRSCSEENDLAEPGYKLNLLNAPQVNLLIAYDVKNKIPLMYRTYRGSSVDKKSVEDLLMSRSFTDTKFIVDRGFFSEAVLTMMSENGNCYIIPLMSSNKDVKRIKKTLHYTSGEFVYKSGKKDSARIIYYEESIDEKTRIIVFKDPKTRVTIIRVLGKTLTRTTQSARVTNNIWMLAKTTIPKKTTTNTVTVGVSISSKLRLWILHQSFILITRGAGPLKRTTITSKTMLISMT